MALPQYVATYESIGKPRGSFHVDIFFIESIPPKTRSIERASRRRKRRRVNHEWQNPGAGGV